MDNESKNDQIIYKVMRNLQEDFKKEFDKLEERLQAGITTFAIHSTEIEYLKADINKFQTKCDKIMVEIGAIKATLDERIREIEITMANETGQPNWLIKLVFGLMVSIIVSLAVYILRGGV